MKKIFLLWAFVGLLLACENPPTGTMTEQSKNLSVRTM